MRISLACCLAIFVMPAIAQQNDVAAKIEQALQNEIRTEAEVARDANRKPVETLSFFRLEDDMRVLELLPGGGWYTKILAPVLRDNGELFVAIGTDNVRDNLLTQPGFDHVNVVELDLEMPRTGPFGTRELGAFDFGVDDIDLVLTFRNMHNFTSDGRTGINAAVFAALKPGGLYGVIDHSRRHMAPITNENRRRVDVVQIIKEALDAGFELVGWNDLHFRPDDELRYEVGRRTVTGNTDRFTLLFRKPA